MPFCSSIGGGFQEIVIDVELTASPVRFSGAALGTEENKRMTQFIVMHHTEYAYSTWLAIVQTLEEHTVPSSSNCIL